MSMAPTQGSDVPQLPLWWKVILIVLSALSFQPQLRMIWSRKTCHDISLYYVFFNLASASEHICLWFNLIVNARLPEAGGHGYIPASLGEWLNFVQLFTVWTFFLILFCACVYFPSQHTLQAKVTLLTIFILCFLASIYSLASEYIYYGIQHHQAPKMHALGIYIVVVIYIIILNPAIIAGMGASLSFQLNRIAPNTSPGDLSLDGLALQGGVFALISISWSLQFWYSVPRGSVSILDWIIAWYLEVGWIALNAALFAFGQLMQLWRASDHWTRITHLPSGETAPLLSAET